MQILTFEELQQKRAEGIMASVQAIHQKYDIYRELKRLVAQINSGPLDVMNYYPTAKRLGVMLREMTSGYNNTIFHYFADHIDPAAKGDVRCFRMECRQLAEQIKELDQRRTAKGRLKVVK
jgi:uncharacterized protein YicC (UPF0701 family)